MAVRLPDGEVLIAGGGSAAVGVARRSAELYNPATGVWTPTGSMAIPRAFGTMTLLRSGEVLVAGGDDCASMPCKVFAGAELYDPLTQLWRRTGSMTVPRDGHSATLLADGRVLVAGGQSTCCPPPTLSSAEIYDPETGTWSPTGWLTMPLQFQTADRLYNGKVLVAGGESSRGVVSSAELYDPETGTWSNTGPMSTVRFQHTMTDLSNGMILVAGGNDGTLTGGTASAELYHPDTGTWTVTGSMSTPRYDDAAVPLPGGRVLVSGGLDNNSTPLASAEIYDVTTGTWSSAGSMSVPRLFHTLTRLSSGDVIAVGGQNMQGVLSSAELYHG